MNQSEYPVILAEQKDFFSTGITRQIEFRIEQLKKLKSILKENEKLLFQAIYHDYKKSEFETYVSELSLIYEEIDTSVCRIRKWTKKKKVKTNIVNFPAKSYIISEPYGNVLIISSWNFPFLLSLTPAVAAMSAGNTIILKPSEITSHSSAALYQIISSAFSENYFAVAEGGIKETSSLLELKFDKIFFTGSVPVGKIVYQAAAKKLTPVTLELGGKSPVFIMPDCDIDISAKRIVWAKFMNAGQSCLAPDYIFVHQNIENEFLNALKKYVIQFYGKNYEASENYVQICNEKHFDRLARLIPDDKIYYGGKRNKELRFIEPTILTNVNFTDEIMQDEIFGPILPVLKFENLSQAIQQVKSLPKPLSCYVFTKSTEVKNRILNEISFGGGCVNDALMHITNSYLPFGGVGNSGIGNYHNEAGFKTFSHFKSILEKPFFFEFQIKYPPYSELKLKLVKWFVG